MNGCLVHVAYNMTLLPGGDPGGLDPYDESSFAEMLDHWREHVSRTLA